VEKVSGEPVLAFDLEADSLHHYQEKVCLIQLSSPSESFLIDPLALRDLSPVGRLMSDPGIRKVFHGADYDIRSLHRDFGIEVVNLFDTMIACQFLGERELGLAAVLRKRFGVELDKRYQKADWSKRPLPRPMIEYAVEDTSLLIRLYGQLKEELQAKGRLEWVEEECLLLSQVRVSARSDEPLFCRFKGAAMLDGRTLILLEELLRFRDEQARVKDLPVFKILGNETLRTVALKKPRRMAELGGITGLTPKLVDRYGKGILEAVERGMSVPAHDLPVYPKQPRKVRDRQAEERLQKLKQWREAKSQQTGVDPGILANNALLESLADLPPGVMDLASVQMKRWQRALFGQEVTELLS
jgi:ribonuclease D